MPDLARGQSPGRRTGVLRPRVGRSPGTNSPGRNLPRRQQGPQWRAAAKTDPFMTLVRLAGGTDRDRSQDRQRKLRRFLDRVPDPRGRRGRRYPAVALLTAAAAAVLAGARSLAAVGEWIADAPQEVRAALGLPPDPLTAWNPAPHAGTVRACSRTSTPTHWTPRSAPTGKHARSVGTRERRADARWRWTARPCADRDGHRDPTAGRDKSPRRGPGPASDQLQGKRDPRLRPATGRPRPHRRRTDHRRTSGPGRRHGSAHGAVAHGIDPCPMTRCLPSI